MTKTHINMRAKRCLRMFEHNIFMTRVSAVFIVAFGFCFMSYAQNGSSEESENPNENLTLRKITGADIKQLYELPTTYLKNNLAIDIEKSPSFGFVIIDPSSNKVLTNSFVTEKEDVKNVTPLDINLTEASDYLELSAEDYSKVRFTIIREIANGTTVSNKDPLAFPVSILYDVDDSKRKAIEMLATNTNPVNFTNSGNQNANSDYHPWIKPQSLESTLFKVYFKFSKDWNLSYRETDDAFTLRTPDPGYNIEIFQLENFSVKTAPSETGGINLSISHRFDDPELADNMHLHVLFNDGATPSTDDLLASSSVKLHDNGGWLTSTVVTPDADNTVKGISPTDAKTLWVLPSCTLQAEDKSASFPVGRILTAKLPDNTSTLISTITTEPTDVCPIYYTLQGIPVSTLTSGNVYIQVIGSKARKILLP